MIRGQFTFYEHPKVDGWADVGGVGIVEAPIGMFHPERIRALQIVGSRDSIFLLLGEYAHHHASGHGAELGHIVVSDCWPRPLPASRTAGGGIMFRRTRVPASPGHEMLSVAMCLHVETGMIQSFMRYDLSAAATGWQSPGEMLLHAPVHVEPLAKRGIGMNGLLKEAAWGWNAEPFALQSTMDLETIDACRELNTLRKIVEPSDEQTKRREALERGEARWIVDIGKGDQDYAEFRRQMPCDPLFDDWSNPVTASQLETRHRTASDVARSIHQRHQEDA